MCVNCKNQLFMSHNLKFIKDNDTNKKITNTPTRFSKTNTFKAQDLKHLHKICKIFFALL